MKPSIYSNDSISAWYTPYHVFVWSVGSICHLFPTIATMKQHGAGEEGCYKAGASEAECNAVFWRCWSSPCKVCNLLDFQISKPPVAVGCDKPPYPQRFCHQGVFHKTSPWYCSDFCASPGVCFALVTLTIPSTHPKWLSDYLQTKALKDEARIAGIHKNTQNASRRVHLFKNN